MFQARTLSHRKRQAREKQRKMLEEIVKYVVYNRVADNHNTLAKLIGSKISEKVVYNNKRYEITTRFTYEDFRKIQRQTAKTV